MRERTLRYAVPAAFSALTYVAGYNKGRSSFVDNIDNSSSFNKEVQQKILSNAFKQGDFSGLSENEIRKNLGKILDKSKIAHGDTMVPSENALSGRYLISQWQRGAIGSGTIILGRDKEGNLCTALGPQRGYLTHPQGYGELIAPIDDMTGLHVNNASRYNKKTGELVPADLTIEDMALREVEEELGLKLLSNDLQKLDFIFGANERGIPAATMIFLVFLNNLPELANSDEEFKGTEFDGDDMDKPRWVKISEIEFTNNQCFYKEVPLLPLTTNLLANSISKYGSEADIENAKQLLQSKQEVSSISR